MKDFTKKLLACAGVLMGSAGALVGCTTNNVNISQEDLDKLIDEVTEYFETQNQEKDIDQNKVDDLVDSVLNDNLQGEAAKNALINYLSNGLVNDKGESIVVLNNYSDINAMGIEQSITATRKVYKKDNVLKILQEYPGEDGEPISLYGEIIYDEDNMNFDYREYDLDNKTYTSTVVTLSSQNAPSVTGFYHEMLLIIMENDVECFVEAIEGNKIDFKIVLVEDNKNVFGTVVNLGFRNNVLEYFSEIEYDRETASKVVTETKIVENKDDINVKSETDTYLDVTEGLYSRSVLDQLKENMDNLPIMTIEGEDFDGSTHTIAKDYDSGLLYAYHDNLTYQFYRKITNNNGVYTFVEEATDEVDKTEEIVNQDKINYHFNLVYGDILASLPNSLEEDEIKDAIFAQMSELQTYGAILQNLDTDVEYKDGLFHATMKVDVIINSQKFIQVSYKLVYSTERFYSIHGEIVPYSNDELVTSNKEEQHYIFTEDFDMDKYNNCGINKRVGDVVFNSFFLVI